MSSNPAREPGSLSRRANLSVSASKEAGERLAEVKDLQRRDKEAMLGMLVVQKKAMLMALKELQVKGGRKVGRDVTKLVPNVVVSRCRNTAVWAEGMLSS